MLPSILMLHGLTRTRKRKEKSFLSIIRIHGLTRTRKRKNKSFLSIIRQRLNNWLSQTRTRSLNRRHITQQLHTLGRAAVALLHHHEREHVGMYGEAMLWCVDQVVTHHRHLFQHYLSPHLGFEQESPLSQG